jgi:predicted phage tail component-like protein
VPGLKTLTFKGQQLPSWLWIIKEPLQIAAPIEWEYMQKKVGAVAVKRKIGARPLPFEVAILADNETDLHQKAEQLAAMLYSEKPEILTRSSEPGREYLATWENNDDFSKILETGEGVITFMVPGGLKGAAEKTGASFSTSQTLTIGGTYKTAPIFEVTFTAAATNYKIAHANGQYVRVIRSFAANDKLIIDHNKELITLNGANIMPALDLNSRFFYLEPGANALTITGSGQTTKAKYKEKWQ